MKNQVKDNRRAVREEFCTEKLLVTTMLSFFKTWKLARLFGPCQRMGTWCREVNNTKNKKRDVLEKQQCQFFAHFQKKSKPQVQVYEYLFKKEDDSNTIGNGNSNNSYKNYNVIHVM